MNSHPHCVSLSGATAGIDEAQIVNIEVGAQSCNAADVQRTSRLNQDDNGLQSAQSVQVTQ